jgi:hypothetical protein
MPSLQDRLIQVSLGGFQEKKTCRSFMSQSFEALGLLHPWSLGSRVATDNQEWLNRLLWDATAGLPKSLNSLGRRIVRRPAIQKEVSFEDMRLESVAMTEEHVREWAGEFPDFVALLNSHPVAFAVVQFIAKNGMTGTHDVAACRRDLVPESAANSEFERALDLLTKSSFLVRTGRAPNIMFVRNPTFAHTLRVVSQDPDAYASIVTLPRTFRLPAEDDPSVNQADDDPGT